MGSSTQHYKKASKITMKFYCNFYFTKTASKITMKFYCNFFFTKTASKITMKFYCNLFFTKKQEFLFASVFVKQGLTFLGFNPNCVAGVLTQGLNRVAP